MNTYDVQPEKPTVLNKANSSVLMRIRKYQFHYLIAIPALLLILFFKVIPFITQLRLPFIHYSIVRGLQGSPSAGLDNFKMIFSNPVFWKVLGNTLVIKLEYILIMALLSIIIAFAVSLVRMKWLRGLFTTVFLIPCFIPAAVLVYIFLIILLPQGSSFNSIGTSILTDPSLARLPVIAVEILRNCGIPVFIAVSAVYCINTGEPGSIPIVNKFLTIVKAVAAFSLIQFTALVSWNFESIYLLLTPKAYETGDVLDTLAYRIGLETSDISYGSAMQLTQFIIQLLLTLAVFFLLKRFLKESLFTRLQKPELSTQPGRLWSWPATVVSVAFCLVFIAPLYFLFIYPFNQGGLQNAGMVPQINIGTAMIIYFLITLFAIIINAFVTVTLAYPLTVRDLPGRNLYIVFLLLAMNLSGYAVSEFLFYRNLGMVDTFLPYIINGFFTVINVFILKESFNSKFGPLKEEQSRLGGSEAGMFLKLFIPKTWKTLLGLMVLQFAAMWNSYFTSMIYTSRVNTYSPVMLFVSVCRGQITSSGEFAGIAATLYLGMLVSIPSIAVFILLRWLFTSDAFISRAR